MNIGVYSIKKKTITLVLTVLALLAGIQAYQNLGRLEDPEFTIKQAVITTPYPGASAEEVEKEVTNEIEKAVQQLGQLKRIRDSYSARGESTVEVEIKDGFDKHSLPQVWDELRRKVNDAQGKLPPGAGPSMVNDDFGDVYGVYIAIRGDGYSHREIKDFADLLRRELLLVQDVKRIALTGVRPEAVYVEMDRDRMAQLGITQDQIFSILETHNLVGDGGRARVGSEYLTIDPTGKFTSEQQFKDLLISEPGAEQLVYLGDVAGVRRDYVQPPTQILRSSGRIHLRDGRELGDEEVRALSGDESDVEILEIVGEPAVGLAISTVLGGNVVTMGEAVAARMKDLMPLAPIGMEGDIIALQSDAVTKSINSFMVNLMEAIAIVVAVLLIFMGPRAGLLIGFILLLTICATFIAMNVQGIMLERISLGALIIALGMLVDNAIVITDAMKMRLERGEDGVEATRAVVAQNQFPLLGSTVVAIIAFGAIGLSKHSTGEYCRSLFYVLLWSLMLSWVTAVTVTPLLCTMLFKPKPKKAGQDADPFGGKFFQAYRALLEACIRFRFFTIAVVCALFVAALFGFGTLKDSFFPYSTRPQFMVDFYLPEGTHIRDTEKTAAELEAFVMSRPNTLRVATHVGAAGARFLLVYSPEKPSSAYGQLLVTVKDYKQIPQDRDAIQDWMDESLPETVSWTKPFKLGPGEGGNIQARFLGPDGDTLRALAREAMDILEADGGAIGVRQTWKEKVKVIRPVLAEAQARRAGVTRLDVNRRIQAAFQGSQVGVYREGTEAWEDRLLPIISRSPESERVDIGSLRDLLIYSPAANRMIPLRQVVSGFETTYEEQYIRRRDRKRAITVHCDQRTGEASEVLARVKERIESLVPDRIAAGELSTEYEFVWGPELEDSTEAIEALSASIPMFAVMMVLMVIVLFNNLRQPLVIWLTVPLAIIGVVLGLVLFDEPFNFMALLGTMSLAGMLIKNSVVLIDEINLNWSTSDDRYEGVVRAGVSRLRPVAMAAATTVLGMLPLFQDAFFIAMAIAVAFGLTFATVLTMVIVPTLTATVYGLKKS